MSRFEALAKGDPRRVGPYQIQARLGAGGMGRVYLARSRDGRQQVAVKLLHAHLAQDPDFRRRFAREVEAAKRIEGPYTIKVVNADPEGSPPWLATEYVASVSLENAVKARGAWPERSVRALGAMLVQALKEIHAAGLVHRDLKPANVLLGVEGLRVIDFGISLAVDASTLTQTGTVLGTPGFTSPEQLTGESVGPPSDVFTLGAVLVYAATGTGPFGMGSVPEVSDRVRHGAPRLGGLPEGLRELVGRCLEKDPARRPTVAELMDRLCEGPGSEGTAAHAGWLPPSVAGLVEERIETVPPPPAGRRPWDIRRRPLIVSGVAVGATALAAVPVTWLLTKPGDSQTVKIAVQGPLSGDEDETGLDMLAGVKQAVDEANASGDYPAFRFKAIRADDGGEKGRAAAAARQVVNDVQVLAVVGPAYSTQAEAAASVYGEAGLAAVTSLATDPELSQRGNSSFLRAVPDDRQQGKLIGEFLAARGAGPVTVIDDASRYGDRLADAVHERLEELGVRLRRESFPPNVDADRVAVEVVESDAAAVAYLGGRSQAALLAHSLAIANFTGLGVCGEGAMHDDFLDKSRGGAEGWFVVGPYYDVSGVPGGRDFADRFQEWRHDAPGLYAPRTYDIAMMIIEEVARLGQGADRASLLQSLHSAHYAGLTGVISFDDQGEFTGTGLNLYRVVEGDFVLEGPVEEFHS